MYCTRLTFPQTGFFLFFFFFFFSVGNNAAVRERVRDVLGSGEGGKGAAARKSG